MKPRSAFTLTELVVVLAILGVLLALLLPVVEKTRSSIWRGVCAHSLQQLATAGAVYRGEHDGSFWKYREDRRDGTDWWFGYESAASRNQNEGARTLDLSRGPLGPYVIAAGGVKADPAFLHFSPRHKPKFANGNFGYGYNALLGGGALGRGKLARQSQFTHPAEIVVFATCAQVNTFQPPATAGNPMIEEFYLLDDRETTVHFRFGGKALAAMMDGSVRELPMDPATLDTRMPDAQIGRFAPTGSARYLADPPEPAEP
jgi:prepilin-type N-terminal cleavage/methylation domain-containing protein